MTHKDIAFKLPQSRHVSTRDRPTRALPLLVTFPLGKSSLTFSPPFPFQNHPKDRNKANPPGIPDECNTTLARPSPSSRSLSLGSLSLNWPPLAVSSSHLYSERYKLRGLRSPPFTSLSRLTHRDRMQHCSLFYGGPPLIDIDNTWHHHV